MTYPRNPHAAHVYLADQAGNPQSSVLALDPTQFKGGIQAGNRIVFTVERVEQVQNRTHIAAIYSGQEQVYVAQMRK